jgi:hypothetical protein
MRCEVPAAGQDRNICGVRVQITATDNGARRRAAAIDDASRDRRKMPVTTGFAVPPWPWSVITRLVAR